MSSSAEVTAYIAAAPTATQPYLRRLRAIIKAEAPAAVEGISYRMPYYRYLGHLMYFAAFPSHVGLYPVGNADRHLGMAEYMTGKGTYRFPLDRPLPEAKIRRLIRTRVQENEAAEKKKKTTTRKKRTGAASRRSASAR